MRSSMLHSSTICRCMMKVTLHNREVYIKPFDNPQLPAVDQLFSAMLGFVFSLMDSQPGQIPADA
jgi:hypothetical protein